MQSETVPWRSAGHAEQIAFAVCDIQRDPRRDSGVRERISRSHPLLAWFSTSDGSRWAALFFNAKCR
jgi:hypothetical protein